MLDIWTRVFKPEFFEEFVPLNLHDIEYLPRRSYGFALVHRCRKCGRQYIIPSWGHEPPASFGAICPGAPSAVS